MAAPFPGFVYSEDLLRQALATEKFVDGQWRRTRRANMGWRLYGGLMTLLVGLLGGALNYALPLIRLEPVFFYQAPNGVVETAITTDSLPLDLSDANIQAWLWQYVLHRESYSWVESDYNHYLVEAMSSVPVRIAFDKWYQGNNPDSYLASYGQRGIIRVQLREITQFKRATGGQPGTITIHFDRLLNVEGEPKQPVQTWTATLQFLQDYSHGFSLQDIKSFNPSRIVVTSYPGSEPLPATATGTTIQGGGR
jgi:type IV secretory pathway component VirB8